MKGIQHIPLEVKKLMSKKEKFNHTCVFCDKENIKSEVIEIENCFVFEPLNPVVRGHLLVVNKVHTKDFTDNENIFSKTDTIPLSV